MHIIMGASGRVGGTVIETLQQRHQKVKAITRDEKKAAAFQQKGIPAAVADAYDASSLIEAYKGGQSLFVITPETGQEEDVLDAARQILDNYRKAVLTLSIPALVGISSMGAQHRVGTGNLQVSYMLEHTFADLPVKQIFIRPAYYFSNWMEYLPVVKESGKLPSFFPSDFSLAMTAPEDVGRFAAEILSAELVGNRKYDIEGPQWYTPGDVAQALSAVLQKEVNVQHIPHEEWAQTLKQAGLSDDAVANFVQMTEAVLDGRSRSEGKTIISVKGTTTLEQYIRDAVKE